MEPKQRERYVRWQNYRINQLTFSINLFLTFAIASLAFAINLKLSSQPITNELGLNLIIGWWATSASLGTIATLSRLLDFRFTARKIKYGRDRDKKIAQCLGYITWGTFWAQVIAYVIGGYLFVGVVSSI